MREPRYVEPFAVQETYVENSTLVLKDGNVIITYIREINGENVAVHRIIWPVKRFIAARERAGRQLAIREPKLPFGITEGPLGAKLS